MHIVKLQLDVNHDGAMDLSSDGPDNTSRTSPMMFWANNDCDRGYITVDLTDYEQDDLASNDSKADCPFTPGRPTLDCEYRDVNGSRVIPSQHPGGLHSTLDLRRDYQSAFSPSPRQHGNAQLGRRGQP